MELRTHITFLDFVNLSNLTQEPANPTSCALLARARESRALPGVHFSEKPACLFLEVSYFQSSTVEGCNLDFYIPTQNDSEWDSRRSDRW